MDTTDLGKHNCIGWDGLLVYFACTDLDTIDFEQHYPNRIGWFAGVFLMYRLGYTDLEKYYHYMMGWFADGLCIYRLGYY